MSQIFRRLPAPHHLLSYYFHQTVKLKNNLPNFLAPSSALPPSPISITYVVLKVSLFTYPTNSRSYILSTTVPNYIPSSPSGHKNCNTYVTIYTHADWSRARSVHLKEVSPSQSWSQQESDKDGLPVVQNFIICDQQYLSYKLIVKLQDYHHRIPQDVWILND